MDDLSNETRIPTEVKLREELERLKRCSGLGMNLKFVWLPDGGNPLSGEVVGNTIKIYEQDEESALLTLRHEFLDHLVSQTIKPYKLVANALVKLVNAQAYEFKEEVVKGLNRLLFSEVETKKGRKAE